MTTKSRWHDATGNGALNGPSGAQPRSRDRYVAHWYDAIGRLTSTGDYGTNENVGPPTRPNSAPFPGGAAPRVSLTQYDARGEVETVLDPAAKLTRTTYDDAGRPISVIRNLGSSPTEEVQTTYNPEGQVETLTAINSTTGNQTTTYFYGVNPPGSGIASNGLLRRVAYPDSGEVLHEYNRQGEQRKLTDQNGTVHEYSYDKLARPVADQVTTFGTGVDQTVKRIAWSYDNRRRLGHVISYDAVTSGNITSDVEYLYNNFSQVITERQHHGGATSDSSPKVQYAYVEGTGNTVRRTSCTYPNALILNYGYGSSGGAGDRLSRVQRLTWNSTDVVDYLYLGLDEVVIQRYLQPNPDVESTLATGSGANPYAGLDRYDRIIDLQWKQSTTELVRLKHGYDQVSNRQYRRDEVARAGSAKFDELYTYDGLHRLTAMNRGELNANNNGLVGSPTLTQGWGLDSTGNWSTFNQTVVAALTQSRAHNPVNEITNITETVGLAWATPAYDANGNTTKLPQPAALNNRYTATYDAWNRLVKLTNDADANKTVAQYEYDGLQRRTLKKVYTNGSLDHTRHYYFSDPWQVLEERVDASTSADRQYVWGLRYVDDLVLRQRASERLYALQDALFNVVAITDTTGAVKQRFAYQPYGQSQELNPNFTAYSGTNYQWEYRFTGRELDLESGLQINRNRYYHSSVGRWLTRDRIGYRSGDTNLYQYVMGRAPTALDPFGLATWVNDPILGRRLELSEQERSQLDLFMSMSEEERNRAIQRWEDQKDGRRAYYPTEPSSEFLFTVGTSIIFGFGPRGTCARGTQTLPPRQPAVPKTTSTELNAFGSKAKPRAPRRGKDIDVDADEMVRPTTPPTDASTFGDVSQAPLTGHYHNLPEGSLTPDSLTITPDGVDPGGPHLPTHHTISPSEPMSFDDFVKSFEELPWKYGGKK